MHSARSARRPRTQAARAQAPDLATSIDRFLDGDDRAFNDVYRALAPRVYGFLLQLTRDPSLAEDLTQETFTRMVQARAECKRGVDVAPWACTIARHLFCDHLRRMRNRTFSPGETDGYERTIGQPAPQPDEALAALSMVGGVEEVLATLPEGQVTAFRLVREEGHSLDEAAARLGRTELSVRLSLHRARTAIRAHLAERWGVAA